MGASFSIDDFEHEYGDIFDVMSVYVAILSVRGVVEDVMDDEGFSCSEKIESMHMVENHLYGLQNEFPVAFELFIHELRDLFALVHSALDRLVRYTLVANPDGSLCIAG